MSHRGAIALVIVGAFAGQAFADDDVEDVQDAEDAEDGEDGEDGEEVEDVDDEPRLIEPAGKGAPDPDDDAPVRKDHYHQFAFGLQIPIGMRAIKPYDAEDYCGQRGEDGAVNAPVCVSRNPQTFDFELAYGVKANLEVMLELRVGLERDFATTATDPDGGPRLFHFAPGVKFYFSDAGVSKLFSTAQLALDFTGYDDASGEGRGVDVVLRNVNGLQLDFHPSYGLYVFVGEELGFRRWLMFGIEAGIGIQGRYP